MRTILTSFVILAAVLHHAPAYAGDVVLTGTVVPMTSQGDEIQDGAVLVRNGMIEEIVAAEVRGKESND